MIRSWQYGERGKNWLHRVMVNLWRDELRKRRRRIQPVKFDDMEYGFEDIRLPVGDAMAEVLQRQQIASDMTKARAIAAELATIPDGLNVNTRRWRAYSIRKRILCSPS